MRIKNMTNLESADDVSSSQLSLSWYRWWYSAAASRNN